MFMQSEWELAHRFQCSRHTIREACERLIGMGLVAKRYGEGLWIVPERCWPLDLLADEVLALRDLASASGQLEDLFHFHRLCMREIGRLAAERQGGGALFSLDLHLFELARAEGWRDDLLIEKCENELFEALVATAASRAYRMSLSSFTRLIDSFELQRPAASPWFPVASWRSLVEAIRQRSAAEAAQLAERLWGVAYVAVREAFGRSRPGAVVTVTPPVEQAPVFEAAPPPNLERTSEPRLETPWAADPPAQPGEPPPENPWAAEPPAQPGEADPPGEDLSAAAPTIPDPPAGSPT